MKKLVIIALTTIALMGATVDAAPIPGDGGDLQVQIDLATGGLTIVNTTGADINYNGIVITSHGGVLDPSKWYPVVRYMGGGVPGTTEAEVRAALGDPDWEDPGMWGGPPTPNPGGNLEGFGVLGAMTPNGLTEYTLENYAILRAGASWSLGNPIAPGSTIEPIVAHNGPGNFEVLYSPAEVAGSVRVTNYNFGEQPGDSQDDAFMPNNSAQVHNRWNNHGGGGRPAWTQWRFENVLAGDGIWFDPPMVSAFLYEAEGDLKFTAVKLPTDIPVGSDNSFIVNDGTGGVVVLAGVLHEFPGDGVTSFIVSGIDPLADAGEEDGFPTYLEFNKTPETEVTFTMTGIPEPATMGLMLFGAIGLLARKRRRG